MGFGECAYLWSQLLFQEIHIFITLEGFLMPLKGENYVRTFFFLLNGLLH